MKPFPCALWILLCAVPLSVLGQDHPDRTVQPGVPQGKITSGEFSDSRIYPGTTRQYSVYVPAQYRVEQPANLMVFMDGAG